MQSIPPASDTLPQEYPAHCTKAVSWSSVIAGAAAAVSLSLILIILGSGLGLASTSVLNRTNQSAVQLSCAVVIWLIIIQWISSALGGYFAGRLRSKYISLHTDEAFFRDTAHGFLAWAVATIAVAIFSASALSSGIAGSAHLMGVAAGAAAAMHPAAPGAEKPAGMAGPAEANLYLVDSLFRSTRPVASGGDERDIHGETTRILMTGLKNGDVSPADRAYLAQLVAARANISQSEATQRVNDTIAQMKAEEDKARQAAETARKTAATLSIFTFLSLLIGAFIASVAGALGGKRRDEY